MNPFAINSIFAIKCPASGEYYNYLDIEHTKKKSRLDTSKQSRHEELYDLESLFVKIKDMHTQVISLRKKFKGLRDVYATSDTALLIQNKEEILNRLSNMIIQEYRIDPSRPSEFTHDTLQKSINYLTIDLVLELNTLRGGKLSIDVPDGLSYYDLKEIIHFFAYEADYESVYGAVRTHEDKLTSIGIDHIHRTAGWQGNAVFFLDKESVTLFQLTNQTSEGVVLKQEILKLFTDDKLETAQKYLKINYELAQ